MCLHTGQSEISFAEGYFSIKESITWLTVDAHTTKVMAYSIGFISTVKLFIIKSALCEYDADVIPEFKIVQIKFIKSDFSETSNISEYLLLSQYDT